MNEALDKQRELWLRRAKRNQVLYPVGYIPNKAVSLGYTLLIQGVKGIELSKAVETSMYEVIYVITLFHTEYGFIGRTYESNEVALTSSGKLYSSSNTEYVFFYSSIPEKTLNFVVEVILIEKNSKKRMLSKPTSIGWIKIPLDRFGITGIMDLFNGSPRTLLLPNVTSTLKQGVRIEYKVLQTIRVHIELTTLIPADCACGPKDIIPGLNGDRLPSQLQSTIDKEELSLIAACQVYINNAVIEIPENFNDTLIVSLAKEYNLPEEAVKVYEVRLKVACHNQWQLVSSGKLMNSIAMTYAGHILKCNGIPTVDNVFLHPSIGLIFQLEYTVTFTRGEKEIETLRLIVGECVTTLIRDSMGEFEAWNFSSSMNTNPQENITGTRFFTLSDKEELVLICEISPNKGVAAFATHTELVSVVNNKRNLEIEHKKKLEELKRQETIETALCPSETSPKQRNPKRQTFPKPELKQPISKAPMKVVKETSKMPQATIILSKTQNPITATAKRMLETSIGNTIPRYDTVILFDKGYSTLLPIEEKNTLPHNIEEDRNDSLKANVILMEFIGFKASNERLRRISFSLKFFNFPEARTDSVTLKSTGTELNTLEYFGSIKGWSNTSTKDPLKKVLKIQYNFDPYSDKRVTPEKALDDFLMYLSGNSCKIWIYDADSKIPIGYCMICLSDLLRGHDPMKTIKKEYDVLTYNNELLGSLLLVLQNIGKRSSPDKTYTEEHKLPMNKTYHKGKVKVTSKPLKVQDLARVTQMSLKVSGDTMYGKSGMIPSEERRKAELIYRYKMEKSLDTTDLCFAKDIEKYRTFSRIHVLENASGSNLERNQLAPLLYTIGEIRFYHLTYVNPYEVETLFSCHLYDPEARNELQLVTDPIQWKYYCTKNKFPEPPDWTLLMSKKGFLLKSGEQVTLLLRMLALAPPSNTERNAIITIHNTNTQSVEQINEIRLVFKETFYNSCYQFLVPENRPIDLILVPEMNSSIMLRAESIKCNNSDVQVRLEGGNIGLSFMSSKSPSSNDLYVVIYSDKYFDEVLCIIYVIAKYYICYDVAEIPGKRLLQHIVIESAKGSRRKLKLYTDNERMLRLNEYQSKTIELNERQSISIEIDVGTYIPGESQAVLHAIDIDTSEVYKRWIFRFKAETPTPIETYNVKIAAEKIMGTYFDYANIANSKKTYEVVSSNMEIIRIDNPILVLAAIEKAQIHIEIKCPKKKEDQEVYIFINELNSGKVDTILFKINDRL